MIDEMVAFLKKEYNTDVMDKRRLESVVVPRAALFNVCRGYYSATTLGRYFGKNHATILHHYKNHDALMLVPQYRESFNALTEILTKYDERARVNKETAESIIEFLRTENESLKQRLERYEEANS
jgi:ubiquinone biosynthesis protein UbiJ